MITEITLMQRNSIPEVVRIHKSAFPDYRSTSLGEIFLRGMYRWFLNQHPETSLVAYNEHQAVGFVVGARPGYGPELFKNCKWHIAIGLISHPKIIFTRKTYWSARALLTSLLPYKIGPDSEVVRPSTENSTLELASIAVDPQFQGKGIARALMNKFETEVFSQEISLITLTTGTENVSARRLYESIGWTIDRVHDGVVNYYKPRPPIDS